MKFSTSRIVALIPVLLLFSIIILVWRVQDAESPEPTSRDIEQTSVSLDVEAKESEPQSLSKATAKVAVESIARGAINGFDNWLTQYVQASPSDRKLLEKEGLALAEHRRAEMTSLIRANPEAALAMAVPYKTRMELPLAIVDLLETPISATANYEVFAFCLAPGQQHQHRIERRATIGEETFDVFTFGRRLGVTTKTGISLHGISIDTTMAMDDDPIRILSQAEREDRGFGSGLVVAIGANIYEVADEQILEKLIERFEEGERTLGPHVGTVFAAMPREDEEGVELLYSEGLPDSDPVVAQSPHTEGPKTMLYIRARYAGQGLAYEPIDLATLTNRQAGCEAFWKDNSYGKSTLTTTFTDTFTLPKTAEYYTGGPHNLLTELLEDLIPLVKAAGIAKGADWDPAHYDFHTVLTQGGTWGYAGGALIGGQMINLSGSGSSHVRTASHEFGHSLGLWHAQYWRTDSTSPIGRDSVPGGYVGDLHNSELIEYGHKFSVMSSQNGTGDSDEGRAHYCSGEKVQLNWLVEADGDWVSIDTSTVTPIRLYRFDVEAAEFGTMTAGVTRGIKINLDSGDYAPTNKRRYWLSYRMLPSNGIAEDWLPHGLLVNWQRESYNGDGTILLDMTPYSRDSPKVVKNPNASSNAKIDNNDKEDAVLIVGRTYSDAVADIHFTPIAQGGSTPNEWLDVVVNIGTQAGNTHPAINTYTATATQVGTGVAVDFAAAATDADGDTVYYSWTFGDNSLVEGSLNSSTATKSWSAEGYYPVRVTASDGKGGSDVREIIIQVGTPSNSNFIQGRVWHGGMPVENARVNIGSEAQAWTTADGRYTLPGLAHGIHTVTAAKEGLTLSPQFTNPVQLGEFNAYGHDFVADEDGVGTGSLELTVTPDEVTLLIGTQGSFSALGWDGTGAAITTSPAWSVSGGGSIDAAGLFTATTAGGPFTVTATQGGASADALVTVVDVLALGIVATDAIAAEPGTDGGMFRIRRFGSAGGDVTAQLAVSGSATSGSDYTAPPTSILIPNGSDFVDVPLAILNDFETESTEEVICHLKLDPTYAVYTPQASATVEILDDGDVTPTVTIISPTRARVMVLAGTSLFIEGSVVDDGLPNPPGATTASWSVLEAPVGGSAILSPPQGLSTVATFSTPGFYRVQLSANDGANSGTAELGVYFGVVPGSLPSSTKEVVYYAMDEGAGSTAVDARGGDSNGTLANGAGWTIADGGIKGTAVILDGVDDQINIDDAYEINENLQFERTIALWFKADDPTKAGKQVLYQQGDSIQGLNIYIEAGVLYIGGWNNGRYGWDRTYLSAALADTDWHHVVLMLDTIYKKELQPDSFSGYLDGIEFARESASMFSPKGGDIAIGARRGGTQYHDGGIDGDGDRFDGTVDEFHLWNRALSGTEIGQLYTWGPTGPELAISSVATDPGSVVIPNGVGIVLDGNVTHTTTPVTTWTNVAAPSGGSVTFGNADTASTTATFSKPGFYTLRLTADDGMQASAIDVNVHAGIDVAANPSTANQIIYYPFNEGSGTTAGNTVGSANNGTLAGGVAWDAGISGSSVVFDGLDDIIPISNTTGINLGGGHRQKTIAMWIRPTDPGTGKKEVLYEQGGGARGLNLYLDGDLLYLGGWNGNGDWKTFLTTPITRGAWQHVVLVLDAPAGGAHQPDGLRAYVNGALVGSGIAGEMPEIKAGNGLGAMKKASKFHDGSNASGGDNYFYSGAIDEFHYFNDRVLSIDEIGLLYSHGNIGARVDAGADQLAAPALRVALAGSSSDDGRWTNSLVHAWTLASGPGVAVFSLPDGAGIDTLVEFTAAGSNTLHLTANDGHVTTFDSVLINMAWVAYFNLFMDGYPSITQPDRGYLANPDGDLWSNFKEYAFGGAPDVADAFDVLSPSMVDNDGQLYFEIRYRRRRDAAARRLTYEIQISDDLTANSWSDLGYTEIGSSVIDADFEEVTLRIDLPIGSAKQRRFCRLRVKIDE